MSDEPKPMTRAELLLQNANDDLSDFRDKLLAAEAKAARFERALQEMLTVIENQQRGEVIHARLKQIAREALEESKP